jgi:sterol desaturase/sphingolipid hydroxylase (fatty acid hydroxylase superfamily)
MAFDTFLLDHESLIRLGFLFGALPLLAGWELLAPRRSLEASRALRWSNNVALAVVNVLTVRVLFPTAAVGLAVFVEGHGSGLFNMVRLPYVLAVILSVLAFDLAVYLVHLAFHTAPVLWRMHRVHHADLDVDVTTALRFHPVQMLLSTLVKLAVILVLGPPVLAVVLFESVFHSLLLFNHSNVRIPPAASRAGRAFSHPGPTTASAPRASRAGFSSRRSSLESLGSRNSPMPRVMWSWPAAGLARYVPNSRSHQGKANPKLLSASILRME